MRILLVEDDPQLGDGIRTGLHQAGYIVDWLQDGLSALHSLEVENFDMVVLDLGLPRLDGISVLKKIRTSGNDVPVLILTARDTVADRVNGLDSGADDYLLKPFDLDELCARVRALSRRHSGRASSLIKYLDIILNPVDRSLRKNGENITLSTREFNILQIFLENIGRVLSRERIEESLFGWDDSLESNATEVHIHHLRKKLGKELIVTIRGVGYMIPKAD
ncbi:MAG: response regulator transcription factor [Gammaproteobacteria bacterium]|nr:response regulator transcription factor [Gammaproteobacteria bacterium]